MKMEINFWATASHVGKVYLSKNLQHKNLPRERPFTKVRVTAPNESKMISTHSSRPHLTLMFKQP